MKKYYFLFLVLISIAFQAQVTFNPGIRAGLNFAKFTESDSGFYNWMDDGDDFYGSDEKAEMSFHTDFYIGFQGNIRFSKFYALQPELNYSRQGGKVKVGNDEFTSKISYLSLQMVNKFYFDKFNLHVGPTIDAVIDDKNINPDNKTDLGFLVGLGYDITPNFGVEARAKKGIIQVAYSNGENHTNVLIQAGVYYTFPKK